MNRLILLPLLLIFACLIAGVFGALHDQISYSVSPEYYTKFKFHQFAIPPQLQNRVGAAIVGWNASWWMGIVIGAFLIPLGLLVPGTSAYVRIMLKVFALVIATTLCFGLGADLLSYLIILPDASRKITVYGHQIDDTAAFLRAGNMHNFSYLGGLIGILVGATYIISTVSRTPPVEHASSIEA